MARPAVLVPQAVLGRRYDGIPWEGRVWSVAHERVTATDGLDSIHCTSLAKAVGDLTTDNALLFRVAAWDVQPDGLPHHISAEWVHLLRPGGVLDGSCVLDLMVAEIEPGSVIEFRASGPDAGTTIDRVQAAMATINARNSA